MREYVAKVGGRYTYIDDFIGLQELAASMVTIFSGCRNFILSGCETSGTNTSFNISEGLVYINGHIRKFAGANGINLTKPYYIYETVDDKNNVPYAQNASQQGYIIYGAAGSGTFPQGKQYIEITSSYVPRLKDEFFGRYALTLDSSFQQQTVNKDLVLKRDLHVKGNLYADNPLLFRNVDNQTEMSIGMGGNGNSLLSFKKNKKELSAINFGNDGILRLTVDGKEKLAVSPGNTAIKDGLLVDELRTYKLAIKDNGLANYADNSQTASVDINRIGYDGKTDIPVHFNVFNGKGKLLFRTDATQVANFSYCPMREESDRPISYVLKDTVHTYLENEYNKSISWEDKNGVVLATFGFSDPANNSLVITHSHNGDIVLQGRKINIVGELNTNGQNISSQFASKKYVDDELGKKVDAIDGMQLSQENFTSVLKAKLDKIKPDDYASGNDIAQAVNGALLKNNNLSDLNSKIEARNNLDVLSKGECEAAYLKKSNKLSDLPALSEEEKAAIRTKIGAGASSMQAELDGMKDKIKEMIKDYCDNKFSERLAINVKTSGGLTFTQIGPVVSIGGMVDAQDKDKVLFNIPNDIGAPATDISGTIDVGYSKKGEDINMGVLWKCAAGTRAIRVLFEHKSASQGALPFHCTYVTKEKKGSTDGFF